MIPSKFNFAYFLYVLFLVYIHGILFYRWLNGAQFVASFETELYVYFLFRESAVEYINCGKVRLIEIFLQFFYF